MSKQKLNAATSAIRYHLEQIHERLEGIETMSFPCPTSTAVQPEPVHECVGYDIVRSGFESFAKPDYTIADSDIAETFSSVSALQAKINSQTDHNGAVYRLVGQHSISTDLRASGRQNMTIYGDPQNKPLLDAGNTSNFGVLVGDSINVKVIGLEVKDAVFHGIMIGRENAESGGSGNQALGNTISGSGATGVVVRNGAESWLIECNEIFDIGDPNSSGSGEAIYVGYGPAGGAGQFAYNGIIRGNYMHDLFGEAVDVKRDSYGITIEYNDIQRISVKSQGAITLAIDDRGTTGYPFDSVVRYNCISDVTTREDNGNGITVGNAPVDIHDNIIFNTAADAIDVQADCDGNSDAVTIYNNILWNYVGLPIRENVQSTGSSGSNPCAITRSNNLVQSDPAANDCLVDPSVFAGPLTDCSGFRAA